MSHPTPAPAGSGVLSTFNNFTPPTDTSTGGLYGLTSDAAGAQFNLAGLPQLGTGSVTGADLLRKFVAMGNGQGDPTIIAAIQHALQLGGYYPQSGSFVPQGGRVQEEDAKALASALNLLATANKGVPQGVGGQSLGQFLTSAAVNGAENGQYAQQTKVHSYQIRTPNAEQVAATYEKVAQQVLGRKPNAEEKAAFVRQFTADYVGTQQTNAHNDYQASITTPAQQAAGAVPPPLAPVGPGTTLTPGSGPRQAQLGLGAADTANNPPDFDASMQSLVDVINQNASQTPGDVQQNVNQQDLPDVATAAEDYARNTHPNEAAANDLGGTLNDFLNLITTKLV